MSRDSGRGKLRGRQKILEREKKKERIERVINVHITCELSDSRLYKLEAL